MRARTVVAIALVATVVALGGCVGCGFLVYKNVSAAIAEVAPPIDAFIAAWNTGDADAAAALVRGDAAAAPPRERIAAQMAVVGRITAREQRNVHIGSYNGESTATLAYGIRGERADGLMRFQLRRRDGAWAISEVAVDVDAATVKPVDAAR